jgi:palmitoyl-protein thioesterase
VENNTRYLTQSTYLADLNNERSSKNPAYRARMMSLNRLVLVKASDDKTVQPPESSLFGYWAWGQPGTVVTMRQTEAYQQDWLGLKTLDSQNKIDTYTFQGGHIHWPKSFWKNTVLPYLDN